MDYETFVGDLCSLLNTTPDSLCAVVLTAVGTTVIFALGRVLGWTARKSASLFWAALSYPFRSKYGKLDVLVIEAMTSDRAQFTPARAGTPGEVVQPPRIDSGNVGAWVTWESPDYVPHVMVGSQNATDLLCAKARKKIRLLLLDKIRAHKDEQQAARLKKLELMAENPTPVKDQGNFNANWVVDAGPNPPVFWANPNAKHSV